MNNFFLLDREQPLEKDFSWGNTKELIRAKDVLKAYVRYDATENGKQVYTVCVTVKDPVIGKRRNYYRFGAYLTKPEAERILQELQAELNKCSPV